MTWDLKGRESLSDYGLKGFWIKMVTNLTSGDRLVFQFFSLYYFFFHSSLGILNIGLCGFGG